MAGALFLIKTDLRDIKSIHRSIKNLREIRETEMLTGPYDIMALAKTIKNKKLERILIDKIRDIKGVEEIETYLFIKFGSSEAALPPKG